MAIWPDHPCRNPSCRSYGRPHPNCRCGDSGASFAHGGTVCAQGMPHNSDCPYYADGGVIDRVHSEHSANHHGLLGLLQGVGKSKSPDYDKHMRIIDEAKSHYARMGDPVDSQYEPPRTLGVKLGHALKENNHEKSAELLHGHPLVGSVGKGHLKEVMEHISGPLLQKEANPDALKASTEFLSQAFRGHDKLENKAKGLFGPDERLKPDKEARTALGNHLEEIRQNPERLLDVGGTLGHYLPEQATQLGALASASSQYLDSLKPKPLPRGPLDVPLPPDKMAQAKYDRQLDIAQQPLLILQNAKDGTLQPQDMVTLKTIYPQLYKSMYTKVGEKLIEAQSEGKEIPYKQRRSLSLFLGQPLDSTMTPQALQAIMKSQGPQQVIQQSSGKPKSDKATETELTQINKVDALSATPAEAREMKDRQI